VVEKCLSIWPQPEGESESDEDEDEDEEMNSEASGSDSSDAEPEEILKKTGKNALKAQIAQEKKIRDKEAELREEKGGEALDINDYERLLVADKDQSYLWIQYMAMILDKLDIEAARRIAQRAIKSVSMSNDADKLNIWIAYMNMESQFGTQESLEQVVKQALEVNDRQKVYL
jgi:rRNA biogenesis protein RRP5